MQAEQARLARVAARLRQIEQEGRQPRYEVLVKRIEAQSIAGIRETITDHADIGRLSDELRSYLQGRGITPNPLSPYLVIYYDAEYLDRGADVEVAAPLEGRLRGNARVTVHELPALADAASVIHTGGYDRISGAYRALVAWTQAKRLRHRWSPTARSTCKAQRRVLIQTTTSPNFSFRSGQYLSYPPSPNRRGIPWNHSSSLNRRSRLSACRLPGFTTSAPYEGGNENNEIGKVWDEFNRRNIEIQNICGPAYGLCFGMPTNGSRGISPAQKSRRPRRSRMV